MGTRVRYSDLVKRGVVKNRTTLGNWQKKYGFPLGQRTGNTRTWDEDTEINPWLAAQPTDPKPAPALKEGSRRGRPRKADRELNTTTRELPMDTERSPPSARPSVLNLVRHKGET